MKVKELLAKPENWCQGAFETPDGRICLTEAIMRSYGFGLEYAEKYTTIQNKIGGVVSNWNDAPERTHAEVLALVTELDI